VNIKLSRHAKRRAKLYNIPESTIIDIVEHANLTVGEQIIIKDIGLKFPLKIVISVEEFTATVLTAYPLKKGTNI
jgi:hypothetical protein